MKLYVVATMVWIPEDNDPPGFGVIGVYRRLEDAVMAVAGDIVSDLEDDEDDIDEAEIINNVRDAFEEPKVDGPAWEYEAITEVTYQVACRRVR